MVAPLLPDLANVFPAYAGMFPGPKKIARNLPRFPRIRGDVPLSTMPRSPCGKFSPHTRGCSAPPEISTVTTTVFPAYAGMFRSPPHHTMASLRFPRIRGDVPTLPTAPHAHSLFSPHTRGCSPAGLLTIHNINVFPAYAGMFLPGQCGFVPAHSFPRIRGDVPAGCKWWPPHPRFSPHTRGCSREPSVLILNAEVFPAYAGMFPSHCTPPTVTVRFPRIRGDVPITLYAPHRDGAFSPHTRGCSSARASRHHGTSVFPAYAGMFL